MRNFEFNFEKKKFIILFFIFFIWAFAFAPSAYAIIFGEDTSGDGGDGYGDYVEELEGVVNIEDVARIWSTPNGWFNVSATKNQLDKEIGLFTHRVLDPNNPTMFSDTLAQSENVLEYGGYVKYIEKKAVPDVGTAFKYKIQN